MYIDGAVAFGVLIVMLTCGVVYYSVRYAVKHIKQDSESAEKNTVDAK